MVGNGKFPNISHIRSNNHYTSQLEPNRKLFLKNVLHVLYVIKNLLSVSQFLQTNYLIFEFHPFHCYIKDQMTGMVLLKGHLYNALYGFDLNNSNTDPHQESNVSSFSHLAFPSLP